MYLRLPGWDPENTLTAMLPSVRWIFQPWAVATTWAFVVSAWIFRVIDAGVPVNQRKGGDNASALLVATVNGQFDLASLLLDRGADPNLVAENGVGPLYATINLAWAPRAGYPQPRAQANQKLSYLEYMKRLLDAGLLCVRDPRNHPLGHAGILRPAFQDKAVVAIPSATRVFPPSGTAGP